MELRIRDFLTFGNRQLLQFHQCENINKKTEIVIGIYPTDKEKYSMMKYVRSD